jgi:hypothetical protein
VEQARRRQPAAGRATLYLTALLVKSKPHIQYHSCLPCRSVSLGPQARTRRLRCTSKRAAPAPLAPTKNARCWKGRCEFDHQCCRRNGLGIILRLRLLRLPSSIPAPSHDWVRRTGARQQLPLATPTFRRRPGPGTASARQRGCVSWATSLRNASAPAARTLARFASEQGGPKSAAWVHPAIANYPSLLHLHR